jgi:hypothetical protein
MLRDWSAFSVQNIIVALYSTLQLIKSKYHSVLTEKHLTELVQTALMKYNISFLKPEHCYRYFMRASIMTSAQHAAREPRCGYPCNIVRINEKESLNKLQVDKQSTPSHLSSARSVLILYRQVAAPDSLHAAAFHGKLLVAQLAK